MGKKFVTGLALGSLAGLAAWSSLDEEQQKHLKAKVRASVYEGMDVVTDYALNALDIADAMVHDYGVDTADKVSGWAQKVKDKKDHLTDHFVSDDFDQQTADIREALQNAHNDDSDDIIIDRTHEDNHDDSDDQSASEK